MTHVQAVRALAAAVTLLLALPWSRAHAEPEPPSTADAYPLERRIQLGFAVRNTTDRLLPDVDIDLFIPMRQAAGQVCCRRITSSPPGKLIADGLGNQAIRLRLDQLPTRAIKTVEARVVLELRRGPRSEPPPPADRWLGLAPLIEVDSPPIRARARELVADSPRATARRLHGWVADHIDYAGYLRDARGARYAIEQGRGDCTEYAHLVVALARASRIPARVMTGYLMRRDGRVSASALHDWAELYFDGAWRLVDAQRRRFDAGYGDYIALRLPGNGDGTFPTDAIRFHAHDEQVEVSAQ